MAITKINTPEIFDLGATNSSLRLPSGNTASRPSSPSTGEWRYNTDDNKVEYWDGSAWFQIDDEAEAAIVPEENFSPTTYLGNGSTNVLSSKIGNAGYFNGSSSNIDVSPPPQDNSGEISISFWARTSSTSRAAFFIFEYNSGGGTAEFLKLENYGYQGTNSLRVTYDNASSFNINNQAISDNAWHHIVVTAGNGNVKVYKDGSLLATNSVTITDRTISAFAIGYRKYANDLYFNGGIDQVRIFNRELLEDNNGVDEIQALADETYADATKSTTDIFGDGHGIALYQLDEDANDTGGGASGYIGSGAIFKATSTSDGIVSGYAPSDMDTTSYTFSQFLFFDNINDEQYIFSNASNSSGNYGFYAIKTNNVGNIIVDLFNTSNVNTRITSTALSAGQWYHLALTWNHSTKVMKLYIDGALDQTSSALSGTVSTNSNTLRYGRSDGAAQNDLLVGKLDQIRIFNAELDQPKIQELADEAYGDSTVSTVDFGGYGGVALYELEGNANDTGNTYNSISETNISYRFDGTPTNVNFLGMAFQPDLVWIKDRDDGADQHAWFDSIRGATKRIFSSSTSEETTTATTLTSFDSNGFSLSSSPAVNQNGNDFVAWCWKAGGASVLNEEGSIDSQVSANQDAGFSIVSYTGAGSGTQTTGHGLSATPELIIIKNRDDAENWIIWHKDFNSSEYIRFISEQKQSSTNFWGGTHSDTIINIGSDRWATICGVGKDYIAYCFHSVDGYQRIGSYTGSGSSGKRVYTTDDGTSTGNGGFRPRWVITKANGGAAYQRWYIQDSTRGGGQVLFADENFAEQSYTSMSFNDDGFTLNTTDGGINAGGTTFFYLAIA